MSQQGLYGSISPGWGKWSKCGIFYSFWRVFVFVLAHLEPELELFEVDDIGNDGNDDL